MGLGILFVGYMLTFGSLFFTTYLYADIIGCAVMIAALLMLCQYQRAFKYPLAATGVLAFVYAAAAAMRLMGYSTPAEGEAMLLGERIYSALQTYAVTVASFLFYAALLYAIARLATDVELPHIAKRCRGYMITFGVYFAVWVLFAALSERVAAASVRVYNVTAAGLTLFNGIWLIMMVLLLMSCMKWIAPAEELEAERMGKEEEAAQAGLLKRIGLKLDRLQEIANTPREEKEAEKLRRELEAAEKNSGTDSDKK